MPRDHTVFCFNTLKYVAKLARSRPTTCLIISEEAKSTIDDFTKKNDFFLPKSSLNLFMKFVYNNMKNYIPGMDCNRTLIPIDSVERT